MKRDAPTSYDRKELRDLSEAVYRKQLGDDDAARMVEKDGDNGEKLRNRAESYDRLSRCYLDVLNEWGFVPEKRVRS